MRSRMFRANTETINVQLSPQKKSLRISPAGDSRAFNKTESVLTMLARSNQEGNVPCFSLESDNADPDCRALIVKGNLEFVLGILNDSQLIDEKAKKRLENALHSTKRKRFDRH